MGFCSNNYRVLGAGGQAIVEFHWGGDGAIHYRGGAYHIVKEGWIGGRWAMRIDNSVIAHASSAGFLSSAKTIHAAGVTYTLRHKFFSSAFELQQGEARVGTIARMHAFTRRASVECSPNVPELVQLFAFWLAAKAWRDSSNSPAAAPPAT
jgi:hypothetical protein